MRLHFDFMGVMSMIRNINPLTFKEFGIILPEIRTDADTAEAEIRHTLRLEHGAAPVYSCQTPCRITPGSETTVLSLEKDGAFHHFYLDKPVVIHPGNRFSLQALKERSTAELSAEPLPEVVGQQDLSGDFFILPKLRVDAVYTFFYQEKEQGFFFPGEAHPMAELTYVDQGTVHSVADGKDLLLEQGDMVLYAPNQWHMQYADIGIAPRFVTVSFDVSGALPEGLFSGKRKAPQAALAILRQMLREQEQGQPCADDMILTLLNQLLICLQRETMPDKLQPANSIHNENEIIRRAQQYIGAHVRQKLSVPIVARHVDVSPSYLTALFHKHLQIAPGEYIRRIKLQESKQMIRENAMNFTEIATALQYSTVHHFSRQFKEKFGITPTEYAKSVR